jgi:hypothetical protein
MGFAYIDGPAQWRFPLAFQGVFAICLVIMASALPDTPRWIFERNRYEQGMQVIANMSGKHVQDVDVQHAGQEISKSLEYERQLGGSWTF